MVGLITVGYILVFQPVVLFSTTIHMYLPHSFTIVQATYTKYKDVKFHSVATSIIPLSEDEITVEDDSRASPTPTKRGFGIAAAR